ncbi:MAG: phosphoenolpyruvate carboxylase [bacterium]
MTRSDSDPKHLPAGLTTTVGVVEEILGTVVARAEGDALFDVVEGVRREMVAFREADDDSDREAALDRTSSTLGDLDVEDRTAFARAYTLYLQLVNVCENAYRTHRLRERLRPEAGSTERMDRAQLTFVLTAHPTESRSPANIRLLRRVQDHLVESLEQGRPLDRGEVENLLHLAWRAGTHPSEKPSVEDEANHLFSLFTDPILSEVISLTRAGHRVLFRSWVGGDKDGHPGVGPEQTRAALNRARSRLLAFVQTVLLPPVQEDVATVKGEGVGPALHRLEHTLSDLATVGDGDGDRIRALLGATAGFQRAYRAAFGIEHPAVRRLQTLVEVFPALVVPLELREERGRFSTDAPIAGMMRGLKAIAGDGPVDGYARAVVVSMTLEAEDLLEAQRLADEVLGESAIPVIPLFELPDVLERAPGILDDAWSDDRFRRAVGERGHVEVMLGYSDTAKRMGMLASRVALHDAMRGIGKWAESAGVTPLFFHGHGGSVGRGGGRIEDLAATWPPRARTPYKHTVQGEMAERTLATPEILRSLVEKVAEVQADPPPYRGVGELARGLARASRAAFEERVASEAFRRLLEQATPYARLQTLTIGSRPVSRGGGGLEDLRAIPWVLCWTQTRLLLHAWLGIGEAWRSVEEESASGERLARASEEDPLFRSYIRLLSFTMAKTEPAVWRRYRKALGKEMPDELMDRLTEDYGGAMELARRGVGTETLLPERPWLEESIRYRAPMIHPLNLLQIGLLGRESWTDAEVELFRETVTGIAAGMLTTG